ERICESEAVMSTEQVSIAQLRKWVSSLEISGIKSLIDAVPAYDKRGLSALYRADPSYTSTEHKLSDEELDALMDKWMKRPIDSQEASEEEWNAIEDEWKERPIGSEEAKSIAKYLTKYNTVNLLAGYDVTDPDDYMGWEARIATDDRYYDSKAFFSLVYETFLDTLYLNFDKAAMHIVSKKFYLNPDTPDDIARRFRAFVESSSAPLPLPETKDIANKVGGPPPEVIELWRNKVQEYKNNVSHKKSGLYARMNVLLDVMSGLDIGEMRKNNTNFDTHLKLAVAEDIPKMEEQYPELKLKENTIRGYRKAKENVIYSTHEKHSQ
ncbi:MAG: hypothetical protein FWE97_04815, partial [Dehalococcoidia bacterium]|nr:hypothetical protein [Dehalococcoidia bacterium]